MSKRKGSRETGNKEEMLAEYDLDPKLGVRGKYHAAYTAGHTTKVHESDGTVSVTYFTLEDGAVIIEPELRSLFPTSESVNHALRSFANSNL